MYDLLSFVPQGDVARRLTLQEFRGVLSCQVWKYVNWTVRSTRAYETGIDVALMLLNLADEYKPSLSPQEYSGDRKILYWFILSCLDRLDRWEEYLDAWSQIRSNTDCELVYDKRAKLKHGIRMEPFILREGSRCLYVHFLYGSSRRKELIERKLEKKRAGKKIGNMLHAVQSALTPDEIQGRINWLKRVYESSNGR